jgi:hypothetical protein
MEWLNFREFGQNRKHITDPGLDLLMHKLCNQLLNIDSLVGDRGFLNNSCISTHHLLVHTDLPEIAKMLRANIVSKTNNAIYRLFNTPHVFINLPTSPPMALQPLHQY